MENHTQPQQNSFFNWLNKSLTVKMAVIGFLILILLIPLVYVQSLIAERAQRQQEVISEINEKWGKEHIISGPFIKIPYIKRTTSNYTDPNSKQVKTSTQYSTSYAYFSPDEIDAKANLDVKTLQRSIYKSAVYEGSILMNGKLAKPDFKTEDVKEEDVQWEKASIVVQTSNLKGIKNNLSIKIGKNNLSLSPKFVELKGENAHDLHSLQSEYFNLKELSSLDFQFKLDVNGSERFSIIPIAKQTKLNMKSNWTSPSFVGEYLPKNEDEKVTKDGFDANWDILYYNRPFSQSFFGGLPNLNEYSFGVNLLVPVDEYQKSERSAKYGYLVISFTFLFFFLIQAVNKVNIHPFQYLLIGLALVMFYTLLISISEHSNFLYAYLIAAVSVIGLISLYTSSVLKKAKFAVFIAASLSALYSFIYVIIQLENYALLAGSIGLFIILGIVMFISRKVEWK